MKNKPKKNGKPKKDALAKVQRHVPAPRPTVASAIEKVLIQGDLTPLSTEQRMEYYGAVCKSLGLNPLTRPFDYIAFKETESSAPRLQLYARKDATDQLRKLHGIAVTTSKHNISDDLATYEVEVCNKQGRTDFGTGVVQLTKWKDGKVIKLTGRELANAIMKAETKAKRRATLSICGLGFLDETEIDTLAEVRFVTPGGRIIEENGTRSATEEVAQHLISEHNAKPLGIKYTPDKKKILLYGNNAVISQARQDCPEMEWIALDHAHQVNADRLPLLETICREYGADIRIKQPESSPDPSPTQASAESSAEIPGAADAQNQSIAPSAGELVGPAQLKLLEQARQEKKMGVVQFTKLLATTGHTGPLEQLTVSRFQQLCTLLDGGKQGKLL